MIEETILNNLLIRKLLKEKYDIETLKINKIARGTAHLYEIFTKNNHYVLKEFPSNYSCEEINKEINIINHLYQDNIKVPAYIRCLDKKYYFIYENKIIILQKFIEGYTIDQNSGNYEQTIESATYLGKIVKSLETFSYKLPERICDNWYSLKNFNESINKYNELITKCNNDEIGKQIKEHLKDKIEMINSIKSKIKLENFNKLSYKNTHGDYSMMQFIYKKGKINGVIDFVTACNMPIIWEIARSYSYIDIDCKNGEFNLEHFVSYVKEFNKYVKLNKYDLEYMPYLYLIQLLNSTYGYKQYIYDNSKKDLLDFGFLRYKICKYLYENAETISKKLLTDIMQ